MAKKSTRDPEKEKYWREILARWKASGLSQAAFCRLEGLNENSFSSWKSIIADRDLELKREKAALRKAERETDLKPETPSFVPLILAGADRPPSKQQNAVVEIRLPGAAVLVYQGVDAETLRTVMLAYRECWY